jgi:nucleoside-triphosphatase THEP1
MRTDVERVSWDAAGPELIQIWSRPDKEHVVIYGPSGSGKTVLESWLMVQRAVRRNSGIVCFCTKRADRAVARIGFPVASSWDELRKHRQAILWANPVANGSERKKHIAMVIEECLDKLFVKESNNLIAFDEIATVEKLSPECRELVDQYLREARSADIDMILMKQRPQGVTREVAAETVYTFSFKPKDAADAERTAEIMGDKKGLTGVLLSLDRQKYEFLAKSEKTGAVFISRLNGLNGTQVPQDTNSHFVKSSRKGVDER